MSVVTIDRIVAWVTIELHGSKLEFVLSDAEDRNGHERDYYFEQLRLAMNEEFRSHRDYELCETSAYGNLSMSFTGPDYSMHVAMLPRIERVVSAWIRQYRIDRMREA